MVDVEGPLEQRDKVLALFDQYYPSFEVPYRERGITYRPPRRRIAIAWKTYPISRNIEEIAQTFIAAYNEFRFLEKAIDEALAELEQDNEAVE